jgi:acetoin utilization deacetylase AcuC-like enzyme
MQAQRPVVAYFYDEEIGNYCYGGGNPMRPHRARMAYSLVDSYGLTQQMIVQRPRPRDFDELTEFHADGRAASVSEQRQHAHAAAWLPRAASYLASCMRAPIKAHGRRGSHGVGPRDWLTGATAGVVSRGLQTTSTSSAASHPTPLTRT